MRKIKKSASRLDLRKMNKMPRKKCFFNYIFLTFFKNYFSIFNDDNDGMEQKKLLNELESFTATATAM